MAGRKRRKANGVVGFIADAISDQQKARAQTQRLEARAQQAWAKENAKMAAANARDKARQTQREAREREIAEGQAEAEVVTRTLQSRLTELRTLLTGTLGEDPYLPWDRFKEPLLIAEFKPSKRLATELPRRGRSSSCQSRRLASVRWHRVGDARTRRRWRKARPPTSRPSPSTARMSGAGGSNWRRRS